MSADAERANLDHHHFEKELFTRHLRELSQRLDTEVPDDPRLASGIPEQMRLEEEAFVRLTGLTRPAAPQTPPPQTADTSLGDGATISFDEPGVLDVDDSAETAEDALDPPLTHAASESVAALRALVEDLERDAAQEAEDMRSADDEAVTEHADAAHEGSTSLPPRKNTNLEELELLIQALEEQPREPEAPQD